MENASPRRRRSTHRRGERPAVAPRVYHQAPAASSFSPSYPGNDERDMCAIGRTCGTVSQSLVRSASGSLVLLPKDTKGRVPKDAWTELYRFLRTKFIRVSSSNGNQFWSVHQRTLLGVCDALVRHSSERVGVEIPTGLPLVFDVKRRCLRKPTTGAIRRPCRGSARWNFGTASDAFRPCESEDEDRG